MIQNKWLFLQKMRGIKSGDWIRIEIDRDNYVFTPSKPSGLYKGYCKVRILKRKTKVVSKIPRRFVRVHINIDGGIIIELNPGGEEFKMYKRYHPHEVKLLLPTELMTNPKPKNKLVFYE